LPLGSRVRFLGARSDARGLMRSAGAFVQASAYEGYGLTLVEAALAGIPIITTDVGIVGDVLEDVLVFETGDTDALARHLESVRNDPALRDRLAAPNEAAARASLRSPEETAQAIRDDLDRVRAR